MRLSLQNRVTERQLSANYRLRISPYRKRVGIVKRYGKDGGVVTGDKMSDSRDITLDFEPAHMTDAAYIDELNELCGFFRNDLSPFYLIDVENNRRTEVACKNISDDPSRDGLEYRIGKAKIELEMLSAHWEDFNLLTVSAAELDSGETIIVANDSYLPAYPEIKIRPERRNPDLWIKNISTGAGFVLGSNAFGPGYEFTIDSSEGKVYLDDGQSRVESSASIADGSGYIHLVPGENRLQYTSIFGALSIDISFRRRYAF